MRNLTAREVKKALEGGIRDFALLIFPYLVPRNIYVKPSEKILSWLNLPEKSPTKKIVVVSARGHLKTTIFSNILPLYRSLRYPNHITYIFSYTQDQAVEFLGRLKSFVESTPPFDNAIGDTWRETKLSFKNGSRIYAKGITSSSTRGPHPHLIVVDDPLPVEAIVPHTSAGLEFVTHQYFSAIAGMDTPSTTTIITGTRMRDDDLFGVLKENSQYCFYEFPCWDTATHDNLLWGEFYTREWLENKQKEMGSLRFAREYECKPLSSSSSLFPLVLTATALEKDYYFQPKRLPPCEDEAGFVVIGADFAISGSASADYTVFTILQALGERIYVLRIEVPQRGLKYTEQAGLLLRLFRQYEADLIVAESNVFQTIFSQVLQSYYLPVKQYRTDMNKNRQDSGIPSMVPLFENRKIVLPGNPDEKDISMQLLKQLEGMVYVKDKVVSLTEHDDMAMSFFLAIVGIRENTNILSSYDGAKDFKFVKLKENINGW